MENYKAELKEASRELTARERIKFKDTSGAVSIDAATNEEPLVIKPKGYAIVAVHNDKADGEKKDYLKYIIEDAEGNTYVTGSESFWKSFMDIYTEMDGTGEDWELKIYKRDSANYKGKQFITCSII